MVNACSKSLCGAVPVRRMLATGVLCLLSAVAAATHAATDEPIQLPAPDTRGAIPLEQLLAQRRSVRAYANAPVSSRELGQLLWAAQGISDPRGRRTAPSAGALYPLELYVVLGNVRGLEPGVYHYQAASHSLHKFAAGDRRAALADAALHQSWMEEAALIVVFAAVDKRTRAKYGAWTDRFVHMEVGHAGQNLFLQAEALGLGSVVVGAFHADVVVQVLGLPQGTQALSLMPVGRKR